MNWTEKKPPTAGISRYDHTTCESPLGQFMIEWKSWKDEPSYDIKLGDEWLNVAYTLDEAKDVCRKYLEDKSEELNEFMNNEKI